MTRPQPTEFDRNLYVPPCAGFAIARDCIDPQLVDEIEKQAKIVTEELDGHRQHG
jgi:hypothetical protein